MDNKRSLEEALAAEKPLYLVGPRVFLAVSFIIYDAIVFLPFKLFAETRSALKPTLIACAFLILMMIGGADASDYSDSIKGDLLSTQALTQPSSTNQDVSFWLLIALVFMLLVLFSVMMGKKQWNSIVQQIKNGASRQTIAQTINRALDVASLYREAGIDENGIANINKNIKLCINSNRENVERNPVWARDQFLVAALEHIYTDSGSRRRTKNAAVCSTTEKAILALHLATLSNNYLNANEQNAGGQQRTCTVDQQQQRLEDTGIEIRDYDSRWNNSMVNATLIQHVRDYPEQIACVNNYNILFNNKVYNTIRLFVGHVLTSSGNLQMLNRDSLFRRFRKMWSDGCFPNLSTDICTPDIKSRLQQTDPKEWLAKRQSYDLTASSADWDKCQNSLDNLLCRIPLTADDRSKYDEQVIFTRITCSFKMDLWHQDKTVSLDSLINKLKQLDATYIFPLAQINLIPCQNVESLQVQQLPTTALPQTTTTPLPEQPDINEDEEDEENEPDLPEVINEIDGVVRGIEDFVFEPVQLAGQWARTHLLMDDIYDANFPAFKTAFSERRTEINYRRFSAQDQTPEDEDELIELAPASVVTRPMLEACNARKALLIERQLGWEDPKEFLQNIDTLSNDEIKLHAIINQFSGSYCLLAWTCKPFFCKQFHAQYNAYSLQKGLIKSKLNTVLKELVKIEEFEELTPLSGDLPPIIQTHNYYIHTEHFENRCQQQRSELIHNATLQPNEVQAYYEKLNTELDSMTNDQLQQHFLMDTVFRTNARMRIMVHNCLPKSILRFDDEKLYFESNNARSRIQSFVKAFIGEEDAANDDRIACKDWLPDARTLRKCQTEQAKLRQTRDGFVDFFALNGQFATQQNNNTWIKSFFLDSVQNGNNPACRFNVLHCEARSVVRNDGSFRVDSARSALHAAIKRGVADMNWKRIRQEIERTNARTFEEIASAQQQVLIANNLLSTNVDGTVNHRAVLDSVDSMDSQTTRLHFLEKPFEGDPVGTRRNVLCPDIPIMVIPDNKWNVENGKRALKACLRQIIANGRRELYRGEQTRLTSLPNSNNSTICDGLLTFFLNENNLSPLNADGFPNFVEMINFVLDPINSGIIRYIYAVDMVPGQIIIHKRLRLLDCRPIAILYGNVQDIQKISLSLLTRLRNDMTQYELFKNPNSQLKPTDLQPHIVDRNDEYRYADFNSAFNTGRLWKTRSIVYSNALISRNKQSPTLWPGKAQCNQVFERCGKDFEVDPRIVYALVNGSCWQPGQPISLLSRCTIYIGSGQEGRPGAHCIDAFGTRPEQRTQKETNIYRILSQTNGKIFVVRLAEYKGQHCVFIGEAASIFTFGLDQLTNFVQGIFLHFANYFPNWTMSDVENYGTYLLGNPKRHQELTYTNQCKLSGVADIPSTSK
ncbi:hypothetical protein M3Y97_00757800 [Aphelenchoides bicaudatus]|nr:hypothetical protein M3Y97_00757800 [Aphelenchoides bicaudatus]